MLQILDLVQNTSPAGTAPGAGMALQNLLEGLENQQDGLPEGFAEALRGLLDALAAAEQAGQGSERMEGDGLQDAAAVSGNPLPPALLQHFLERLPALASAGSSALAIESEAGGRPGALDDGPARQALASLLQSVRNQEGALEGTNPARLPANPAVDAGVARPELALAALLQDQATSDEAAERDLSRSIDALRQGMQLVDGGVRQAVSPLPQPRPLQLPVQHPQWGAEFGQRVAWMIDHAIKSAEIHLDPPDLGPMRLHLKLEGDQVQLAIQAHHPQVRDALEQNLPRLREFLGGQGMSLVQVDISQHGFSGQQGQDHGAGSGNGEGLALSDGGEVAEAVTRPVVRGEGMIDTYV